MIRSHGRGRGVQPYDFYMKGIRKRRVRDHNKSDFTCLKTLQTGRSIVPVDTSTNQKDVEANVSKSTSLCSNHQPHSDPPPPLRRQDDYIRQRLHVTKTSGRRHRRRTNITKGQAPSSKHQDLPVRRTNVLITSLSSMISSGQGSSA